MNHYLWHLQDSAQTWPVLVLKSGDLPDGQKHPSTQWSSHTWLLWGLLQVSVQGLSHSLYSMLKGHVFAIQHKKNFKLLNSDSDKNTVKTSRLEHVNVWMAFLTTQLRGLPLLWFPACMSTLTGELRYGWTQTWSTAAVTVAQVLCTGFDERVSINQVLAAEECRSWQQVLTKVCLWVKVYDVF